MTTTFGGRSMVITSRDEAIFAQLFFAPLQTTEQLRYGNFPSVEACKERLYKVRRKTRLIDCWTPWSGYTVWSLSRRGWKREAEGFDREGDRFRDWPTKRKIRHFVDTNNLYVRAAPKLEKLLGDHPEWVWLDERRSFCRYPVPGRPKSLASHSPDAEIRFGDYLFFVECQTSRAREAYTSFDDRCRRYRRYLDYLGRDESKTILLYVCDTERDMEYAKQAAMDHRVPHWTGTVGSIARFLQQTAEAHTESQLKSSA